MRKMRRSGDGSGDVLHAPALRTYMLHTVVCLRHASGERRGVLVCAATGMKLTTSRSAEEARHKKPRVT